MFATSLNNGGSDRIGTIKAWGGTTAPAGWLICDGSAISRTLYAGLFAIIGTKYGAGNGTTTFNLPDMLGFCKNQAIIGNGKTLGLTNGTINAGLMETDHYGASIDSNSYGTSLPSKSIYSTNFSDGDRVGITTDSTKSGIVTANKATQESLAIIKY